MGACLRVFLTCENQTLLKFRTADLLHKLEDRTEVIRLNVHGWYAHGRYVKKIAVHFKWTTQKVREVLLLNARDLEITRSRRKNRAYIFSFCLNVVLK